MADNIGKPHGLPLIPPPRRVLRPRTELLALLVLLVPLAYLAFAWMNGNTFARSGRVTTGHILHLNGMIYNEVLYTYEIEYDYLGMPESMVRASASPASIGASPIYQHLMPDQELSITYLPNKPSASRIGKPADFTFEKHFRNREALPLSAALVILIALGAYVESLVRGRRDFNLLTHGTAIPGRVTALQVTNIKSPYGPTSQMYYATYAFIGPDGKEVTKRRQVKSKLFKQLKQDQKVLVLYDPSHPNRHGAYPLLRARLASQEEHEAALAFDDSAGEPEVPPTAESAPMEAPAPQQERTFDEWKEDVIAGYQAELKMTHEEVVRYLTRRPYPAKIRLAGLAVAVVVLMALFQSPKYLHLAVQLEQARIMANEGRYEETIAILEKARKAGLDRPSADYLLAKTYFLTGDIESARPLDTMELSDEQNEQLSAIADQIKAAAPYLKKARKAAARQDIESALPDLEKAAAAWPTSAFVNGSLAGVYAGMYFRTTDDAYLAKYRKQMEILRRMFPSTAEALDRANGDITKYKPASLLADEALKLLNAKKADEALAKLKESLAIYSRQSKSHAYLAIAYARKYEATGDTQFKELCLTEYKTAVKLNPARKSVKAELGALAGEVD